MNYCHEICELLEIKGVFRTLRPPIATGLTRSIAKSWVRLCGSSMIPSTEAH